MGRFLVAILGLPLVFVSFFVVYVLVTSSTNEGLPMLLSGRYLALSYIATVIVFTFFLAGSIFALLVKTRSVNWWHAMLVGSLIGFSVYMPAWVQLFNDKLHFAFRIAQFQNNVQFGAIGLLHGLVFWLLAIWRNPLFSAMLSKSQINK